MGSPKGRDISTKNYIYEGLQNVWPKIGGHSGGGGRILELFDYLTLRLKKRERGGGPKREEEGDFQVKNLLWNE